VYLLFTHDPPGVTADDAAGGRVSRLVRVEANPAQGFNVALPGMQLPRTTVGGPGHVVLLGTNSTLSNIGNTSNGRDTTKASCMLGFSMSNPPVEDCIPADERSHTIGSVAFASDGSLFVSSGDGSNYTAVDVRALRAQNLDSLAGKILRIDPDSALGLPDNPYYNALSPGSNRSKVWASGLRNPFRIAVDPATNDPYVGDVGWSTWEEIDKGKGANFGWPCYEGGLSSGVEGGLTTSVRQPGYETNGATSAACAALYAAGLGAVKTPTFTYNHSGTDGYGSSSGASANGGALYPGGSYPATFWGRLFIADYNRRWIRTLSFDAQGVASVANFVKESANGFVQVLRGPDTNLYVVVYHATGSEVRRIRYTAGGNTPPTAVASATPTSGSVPLAVSFSSLGSFDPDAQPLGYAWDFGDGATSAQEDPQHTYTASGTYVAELTVSELNAPFASSSEEVVITVGAVPPLAVISAPPDGTSFGIGDQVTYAGGASAGGFPLPPSALSWELREHHNQHLHYDTLGVGAGGVLVMEDHADGAWYELCLTAVDQTLVDTQCVDLLPRQTQVTLDSDPVGALLVYEEEGIQLPAPAIVVPTQGALRTVTAPLIQAWRSFDRWTDGVTTRTRQFTVGSVPLTFTARYLNQPPISAGAASVGSGPGRLNVGFSGAGSLDPEGGALEYSWDFGDVQSGSGIAPIHVYAAPGSYVATLTVIDPIGGTASGTVAVNIPNGEPVASFTTTPASGMAPLLVSFDATDSADPDGDAPLAYAWNFGDGATATGAQVSHTYAAVGTYTATLGVSDPFLATATAQAIVIVTQAAPSPTSGGCGLGPELAVLIPALLALRRRRET
jgi:PKD repeat protein